MLGRVFTFGLGWLTYVSSAHPGFSRSPFTTNFVALESPVLAPGEIAPEVQDLPPQLESFAPGTKRVKIRYGKFALPKVSQTTLTSWLTGDPGTLATVAVNMKKPCSNCAILSLQAGLEYANGTEATAETGGWLHHMVLVTTGSGRWDAACGYPFERLFSSGNERTPSNVGQSGANGMKAAYHLKDSDTMSAQIELMNMRDEYQDVWLTMTYEFVPVFPTEWKQLSVVWLDITGCGPSFMKPPAQQKYTLSYTWTSKLDGTMIGAGGHLHDGGTDVTLYHNKNLVCTSQASYSAENSSSKNEPGGHHRSEAGNTGVEHIEKMSICTNLGQIKKGDKIEIDASYDYGQHKAMKATNGENGMIMGIALMYIGHD